MSKASAISDISTKRLKKMNRNVSKVTVIIDIPEKALLKKILNVVEGVGADMNAGLKELITVVKP